MPSKKKDSRTVCVVTVFYKRQYLGSLVFDSPETGEAITSAVQTMLGPSGEQDVSFETTLQPLYDTETIEGELQEIIKSLIPSVPSTPTVDLGKLLTEEHEAEFDTGSNSYRYDSERRALTWDGCENYIVRLSPSRMEVITHEPATETHPHEEIHKFVYSRIGK